MDAYLGWPLPNAWLGVSVENQETADERIPLLLETSAAVRFVSYEPALGPVDFSGYLPEMAPYGDGMLGDSSMTVGLDWVIVGGESGPGARPCRVEWIRGVIAQCDAAATPVFVKQLGANPTRGGTRHVLLRDAKGSDPAEWEPDLRRQEWPR